MTEPKNFSLEIITTRPALSRMHVRFYAYDSMGRFAGVCDGVISRRDIGAWMAQIHDFEAKALQDELPFA